MSKYFLIESRDPSEGDTEYLEGLATSLQAGAHDVTLFLVQNGVFAARPGPASARLEALRGKGVAVFADDFSLRERGISAERLAPGVRPAPIELVVDQLAAGVRVVWH